MKTLVRAEILKARTTRSVVALLAGMLTLVGLAAFGTERSLEASELVGGVAPELFVTVAAAIVPLFALVLGIRSATDEFRSGSIVPTLLATPKRWRVIAAKVVVTSAIGGGFGLAAAGLAAGIGSMLVASEGASVLLAPASLAWLVAKVAGVAAVTAVIGLGVGTLIRHQVAAIVGGLMWFLVAENLADGLAPAFAKYLPVHAMNAVVGGPMGTALGVGLGGVLLVAWAVAAVAGGVAALARRDVVS